MFGFLIGTICLVALVAMIVKHRRQAYGWGGHGWGGGCGRGWHGRGGGFWGGHGHHHGMGFGGGSRFDRFFLRGLFERLETTPGQEKVILKAVEDVKQAVRDSRGEVDKTREDVQRAMSTDSFDESAIAAAFIRQDDEISKVRKAVVGALAEVHGALDESQRRTLADILARFGGRGGGDWRRQTEAGPYRA